MEKITQWLQINCIPEYTKYKGVYGWYWCFRKDCENAYDGINDDRLTWYTNEEMIENFNNNKISSHG